MKQTYTNNRLAIFLFMTLMITMGGAKVGWGQYFVDFEGDGETKGAYASGTVNLSGLDWNLTEAVIGTLAADWKNGDRSLRMRGYGVSSMTMLENKPNGIGTISFSYRRYGTDAQVDWMVEYSVDNGLNWTKIGSDFTAPASDDIQTFSETVDVEGNIRIRIKRATETGTDNRRLNIDDITITDYITDPTVNVNPTTLSGLTYEVGSGPSAEQSFTVSGQNLTEEITLTPPTNYEISTGTGASFAATDPITLAQSGGNVASTTIYVRLKSGLAAGSYDETITASSIGADGKTVTLNGSVTAPPPSAQVLLRPAYIDISTTTSESAVLVKLDNYPSDDARYRLFSGSNQYNAWDASTNSYITSTTYASGPLVPGTPSSGTSFWIFFQRGNNNSTTASYRDRLGPEYNSNYQTQELPLAVEIASPYSISQTEVGLAHSDYSVKHAVLAFDNTNGDTLISATSTELTSGNFGLVIPETTTVRRIELRATDNTLLESKTGEWPPASSSSSGDGDWLSVNWTNGLPASGTNITINSNIIISSHVETANLSILSGNSLTISTSGSLTINGALSNSAGTSGLVIKSDTTGTGSLIHNDPDKTGVQATVERYIPPTQNWGSIPNYTGWHLVSSPVAAQVVAEGNWTPTDSGYDFYAWSEATGTWLNQKQPANNITAFTPGRGYLVANEETPNKIFSGAINTGDQSVSLTNNTSKSGGYAGWNLVGNPFASAINLGSFSLPTDVSSPLVWNSAGASYESPIDGYISPAGGIVPAMNGFMVHANTNTNLTIPASARVHSSTNFYKQAGEEQIVLIAHDQTHNTFQKSIVRFHPEAIDGFDPRHDAYFLQGFAPRFFSMADENRLVMNTLPQLTNDLTIGMGFIKNPGHDFLIELSETIPNTTLFLADLKTGTVHELSFDSPYAFTAEEDDDPMRFELRFQALGDPTSTKPPVNEHQARIYTSGNTLYINFNEATAGNRLEVYDLSGRLLIQQQLSQATHHQHTLNLQTGVYVVRLTGPQHIQTERVFVP